MCQFTHTSFIVYVFMFECAFLFFLFFFSRYYSISRAKEFKKVKRIALITIIDVFIVIVLISFSHHAYISTQKPQHQMIAMLKIVDNFVCMAVVCRLTFKTYKLTGLIFQQALSLSLLHSLFRSLPWIHRASFCAMHIEWKMLVGKTISQSKILDHVVPI